MTFHEPKTVLNPSGKPVAKVHYELSIKNQYKSTLKQPLIHQTHQKKTYFPIIESVRTIGITDIEFQQAKTDILKYMSELPQKDINNIGMIIFDWSSEKRGEAIQDSLPESYWDEKGREQSMKDYKKFIKKPNRSAILFNPIWGNNNRLNQSTVYHEIGHTLFHNFIPSGSDVIFWNVQANKYGWDGMIDDIIKKYPTHKGGLGRGSLVREYLADHYSAYHLNKGIPIEEKQWFENYYIK